MGPTGQEIRVIQLSCESFSNLLEVADPASLAVIARESGKNVSRDIIEFWFTDATPDSVVKYLQLMSQYQKLFTLESRRRNGKFVVIVHHTFGEKASIWFLNFVSEVIRTNLGTNPSREAGKSYVRFEFQLTEAKVGDVAKRSSVLQQPMVRDYGILNRRR
jgi:hypothetical protein